ncbi:hypothetical protein PWG71_10315 [Nocardiopsis sp. N85]|uniref:hypothetical protein n=1 Tax=Nocardiopsis sp. N85 TaxID=3029400 RepID=UPI00237F4D9B|nr:hypothetical protein [Nocardiopsis sp. N85]MDE3721782.1 hypothetical protein [Nocardiopsis sp. N85]
MIPQPRNTAGTRSIPDVIRDPRQWWWGVQGGNPKVAEQDMHDLRQGRPLQAVAHLRRGRFIRQGLLIMHFAAAERLTWRKWRPFLTYAPPIPVPPPIEAVTVREPSSFQEHQLGDVRIINFRSGSQEWEMAVVTIDAPVVTTALREAASWSAPPAPGDL